MSEQRIHTVERPYLLHFHATGTTYPLTSEEAQRLLDAYPAVKADARKVMLRADDGHHTTILAATLGGGPAFEFEVQS